ncbi:MAG: hypothetical protein QOJ09_1489 [Actinomycetota bacterium]|nr:hypothetical protein [Actinomycetota bacterium]
MQKRLALLVVLVMFAVGACGGSGQKSDGLRAAAAKTVGARSARTAVTLVTTTTMQPAPSTTKGEGAVDFASKRASFAIDTSSLGLPGVSGTVEIVLVDGIIYAKLPNLLPTKPWLKLDRTTLGAAGGASAAGLGDLASGDPASGIRFLEGVADGATKVGKEKVRGTDTTHYRGTVDLIKIKASASTGTRTAIDALVKQLGKSTYPVDVWLDGAGRVRRLRSRHASPARGATPASTVVRTEEYFDFGVKVDASPPPPDQVTDLAQLLKGAGRPAG